MTDLTGFRDFGVGAGVLAMAARLAAPVVRELWRVGGHRNGNGNGNGATTYLEGKDAGEVLVHLKQIAANTAAIPEIARTNGDILTAVASTRDALASHEAATQTRVAELLKKIAEGKRFTPRTRRKP